MWLSDGVYFLSVVDINVGGFTWPPILYFTTAPTQHGLAGTTDSTTETRSKTVSHKNCGSFGAVLPIGLIYRKQRIRRSIFFNNETSKCCVCVCVCVLKGSVFLSRCSMLRDWKLGSRSFLSLYLYVYVSLQSQHLK